MLFGWLHSCWRRLITAVVDGGGSPHTHVSVLLQTPLLLSAPVWLQRSDTQEHVLEVGKDRTVSRLGIEFLMELESHIMYLSPFFFQIFKNLFYFEIIFNSEELGKQYREFPPTQLLLLLTCYLTMEQLSKLRRWSWRRAVNYRPDSGSPAFPLAIFVLWDPLWVPRVPSSASLWLLGP